MRRSAVPSLSLQQGFPAFRFNGLFAPYWRSDARGMMIGLTQFTSKNHICRAAIEAVAFQVTIQRLSKLGCF